MKIKKYQNALTFLNAMQRDSEARAHIQALARWGTFEAAPYQIAGAVEVAAGKGLSA